MSRVDWAAEAAILLKGRKITGVRYMSPAEAVAMGWTTRGVVLMLDNGLDIFPSADDEGNGAGALFTSSSTMPALPVLSL